MSHRLGTSQRPGLFSETGTESSSQQKAWQNKVPSDPASLNIEYRVSKYLICTPLIETMTGHESGDRIWWQGKYMGLFFLVLFLIPGCKYVQSVLFM